MITPCFTFWVWRCWCLRVWVCRSAGWPFPARSCAHWALPSHWPLAARSINPSSCSFHSWCGRLKTSPCSSPRGRSPTRSSSSSSGLISPSAPTCTLSAASGSLTLVVSPARSSITGTVSPCPGSGSLWPTPPQSSQLVVLIGQILPLQGLYLEDPLVVLLVSRFQLPPPVDIHWIF